MSSRPGEDRLRREIGAICCHCNAEIELSEGEQELLATGSGPGQHHILEIDAACCECGANRRKLVVRPYTKQ